MIIQIYSFVLLSHILYIGRMILVTGGTGLVGAHLLVRLSQKHDKIRAIYRNDNRLKAVEQVFSYYFDDIKPFFSKIEWMQADITDTTSLDPVFKNVEYVYHAAAMISFQPKLYKNMRKINIEGTANIVNYAIAAGVKKLCHVSSVAAVGKSIKDQVITESNEWSVETSNYGYAITKHGAEMEVWRGTQEGLDAVVVNPGIILGEGLWNSGSSKLFSKVSKGMRFYTEGVTGYVDVRDVVKSMELLMESAIINKRYILVAENRSYKSVFSEIAKCFGKRKPSIKVSEFMSGVGWRVSSIVSMLSRKEPLLTKHSAKSIHRKSVFSSDKIKEELGFEFTLSSDSISRICKNFNK